MPLCPDVESRLGSWRRELREHVQEVIESDGSGPIGTDGDPYPDGEQVGFAPLLVLFGGRRVTDTDRSALGPAAAVEFARLHLREHGALVREDGTPPTTPLLAGDLYRALASRFVVEQEFPPSRRLEALDILSRSVLDQVEAIGLDESIDFDWLLADGAVEISTVLFALSDDQRQTLRAYTRRLRSSRRDSRSLSSGKTPSENAIED
ncbi:MAG: hypothetical protein ACI9YT_000957 [Halobacteriales archaeon]|jgi:hypothetical protein